MLVWQRDTGSRERATDLLQQYLQQNNHKPKYKIHVHKTIVIYLNIVLNK